MKGPFDFLLKSHCIKNSTKEETESSLMQSEKGTE